jgi:hypothetical protein
LDEYLKMKKQIMNIRAQHWQSAMAATPASLASIFVQPAYRADAQSIHCNIVPRFPAERARARHTRIEAFKFPAVGCFGEPRANP